MAKTFKPQRFHSQNTEKAIELLAHYSKCDLAFHLENPGRKMDATTMHHLAAAISLTNVLIEHDARAKHSAPIKEDELALLALAKEEYKQALLNRYPRHLDKGEPYYDHLTTEFVEEVQELINRGPQKGPAR